MDAYLKALEWPEAREKTLRIAGYRETYIKTARRYQLTSYKGVTPGRVESSRTAAGKVNWRGCRGKQPGGPSTTASSVNGQEAQAAQRPPTGPRGQQTGMETYTGTIFSLKKEDTLTRATTWMSLGDTTLSEAGLALRTNAVMILILGSPDPGHRHRGRR